MKYSLLTIALVATSTHAFTTSPGHQSPRPATTSLSARRNDAGNFFITAALVSAIAIGGPVFADEYGVETEAPTLFTGETVMVRYFL
jgi:hypothetical protein